MWEFDRWLNSFNVSIFNSKFHFIPFKINLCNIYINSIYITTIFRKISPPAFKLIFGDEKFETNQSTESTIRFVEIWFSYSEPISKYCTGSCRNGKLTDWQTSQKLHCMGCINLWINNSKYKYTSKVRL